MTLLISSFESIFLRNDFNLILYQERIEKRRRRASLILYQKRIEKGDAELVCRLELSNIQKFSCFKCVVTLCR